MHDPAFSLFVKGSAVDHLRFRPSGQGLLALADIRRNRCDR
jgi:hypothetical protein